MSIFGRKAAREAAARRKLVENCPRHEPKCIRTAGGRTVGFTIHFYKCETCGWAYGYDRRLAEREGLPLPDLVESEHG